MRAGRVEVEEHCIAVVTFPNPTLISSVSTAHEEIIERLMIVRPEGKRKKGRPRMRWMDGVEKDLRNLGVVNWRAKAQETDGWRKFQDPQRVVVSIIIIIIIIITDGAYVTRTGKVRSKSALCLN
jgi:hypothetical protein